MNQIILKYGYSVPTGLLMAEPAIDLSAGVLYVGGDPSISGNIEFPSKNEIDASLNVLFNKDIEIDASLQNRTKVYTSNPYQTQFSTIQNEDGSILIKVFQPGDEMMGQPDFWAQMEFASYGFVFSNDTGVKMSLVMGGSGIRFDNVPAYYLDDYSTQYSERSVPDVGYIQTNFATLGHSHAQDSSIEVLFNKDIEIDASLATVQSAITEVNTNLRTLDASVASMYSNTYLDASFNKVYTDVSNNYMPLNAKFSTANSAYLVSASDNNNIILVDVSALTITFPNTLAVGFQTTVVNETTGICTLNASTLLTTDSSVVLRDRYAAASVVCKSTGVFLAFGNLK